MSDFDAEVQRCNTVYNGAMERNWGFVSLTEAEFRYMAGRLKQLAEPRMVLLAEVDGYPVGFSITLPDMNEAVRPLDGRLFPYGLPINVVRFLWRKRHIKTARMIVLDVLEKYRRRGIAEMLILKTLDFGKNVAHYTGAELGWTLEDNYLVNQTIEAVGAKKYKVYRIYEKSIGGYGLNRRHPVDGAFGLATSPPRLSLRQGMPIMYIDIHRLSGRSFGRKRSSIP